jgi:hypothetical protein
MSCKFREDIACITYIRVTGNLYLDTLFGGGTLGTDWTDWTHGNFQYPDVLKMPNSFSRVVDVDPGAVGVPSEISVRLSQMVEGKLT